MDPITAMILAMAIAGITGRFIGGGVAEAAAAIKGKPSPAAQKWQAREKARQARGERAEHKPGLLRVLWDNAIEARTQKAADRHVGRMEALREMAGTEQAKAREKLLRQAQRRAAVAEKVAGLGNQSWGHARRLAGDTAAVINERRAERAARRGDEDSAVDVDVPGAAAAPENTGEDEGVVPERVEGEAEVIPFRRRESTFNEVEQRMRANREAAAEERRRLAGVAGIDPALVEALQMTDRDVEEYARQAEIAGENELAYTPPTEAELRERFGDRGQNSAASGSSSSGGSAAQALMREIAENRVERERVAAEAGTNSAPTPGMYSDWRRAQGREARTEQELRERFGAATEADLKATQTRGSFRVIPEWRDANSTWQMWHQGHISTQQLHQELLDDSGIDPRLATELRMTAADLSPYAAQANACLETDEVYSPPTETELRKKLGRAAQETAAGEEPDPAEEKRIDADEVRRRMSRGQMTKAEVFETAQIDPELAEELDIPLQDVQRLAASALNRRELELTYTPPTDDVLRRIYGPREERPVRRVETMPAAPVTRQADEVSSGRILSTKQAAIQATQQRGQYREVEGWGRANDIWKRWHDGQITAAERDAELADKAEIDPELANELGMTAVDLSPHAGRGLGARWRGMAYEPPSEADLRRVFGSTDAVAVAPMLQGQFREMFGEEVGDIWQAWQQGRIGERERDYALADVVGVELGDGEPGHNNPLYLSWLAARDRDHNADWWGALELLRQQQAAGDSGPDSEPEHENTVDGGNHDMTTATAAPTTTVPEIADLATGIDYTTTISGHFSNLGAKLAEDADVVGNNAEAFDSQVGVIEAGQAALAAQGFGGVIQSSFDEVAEKLPSAASKLRQIQTLLAEVGEEITSAASSMQSAKTALEEQRGLAEQVQAQSTSNGVARDTGFYQEA